MFEIETEDGSIAKVMTEDIEEDTYDQIREMLGSEGVENDVVIQADCHPGAGSVIGFTMPLGEKIIPNIVGVDVGCGVLAFKIGSNLPLDHSEREERIRDSIPMGGEVNNHKTSVHLVNEFPWDETNEILNKFKQKYLKKFNREITPPFEFDEYNKNYFERLCKRVLSDSRANNNYIINSVATLGGGNHFIEFSKSNKTDDYWGVIHSGSRFLGKSVAEYWQDIAKERNKSINMKNSLEKLLQENPNYRDYIKFDVENVDSKEFLQWVEGGMDESFVNYSKIKEDYKENNPNKIEEISSKIKDAVYKDNKFNKELAWLDGEDSYGYYIDMIFAQQYARFNRNKMKDRICKQLEIEPKEVIESTHNYIDFRDLIVRKGATPSRKGEKLVIPFNMAQGTVICEGKGNSNYLNTAPHGAGRTKSRAKAKEDISMEEFEKDMKDIYSESIRKEVLDEAPSAYKNMDKIMKSLRKTAEPIEHLEVVHNLKGY